MELRTKKRRPTRTNMKDNNGHSLHKVKARSTHLFFRFFLCIFTNTVLFIFRMGHTIKKLCYKSVFHLIFVAHFYMHKASFCRPLKTGMKKPLAANVEPFSLWFVFL